MKRVTITIPDDLAAALEAESERRNASSSSIVQEALGSYFVAPSSPGVLRIANLGASGRHDISERVEEILAHEFGAAGLDEVEVTPVPAREPRLKDDRRSA